MIFLCFFCTHLLPSFCASRGHSSVVPSPSRFLPQFVSRIEFSHLTARRSFIECCCTLSPFPQVNLCTRKSSQELKRMCARGQSNSQKLTYYTRFEDNLIRHRGDRLTYVPCLAHRRLTLGFNFQMSSCFGGGTNCVRHDICVHHFRFCYGYIFPLVFLYSRVIGGCLVTTDLILRVNVKTTPQQQQQHHHHHQQHIITPSIIIVLF